VSNIKPDDVHYIEAHRTRTALGDLIEVEALAGVNSNIRVWAQYCSVLKHIESECSLKELLV